MSRVTDGIARQRLDARRAGRQRRRPRRDRARRRRRRRRRQAVRARRPPARAGRARRCDVPSSRQRGRAAGHQPRFAVWLGRERRTPRRLADALDDALHVEEVDRRGVPPPQWSPPTAPVQAHARARRSPPRRVKRSPISNSRTSRCSRRRLWATASTRPGSADGRSTAKFSDSGLVIGTRSPSAANGAAAALADEAERHRFGEAGAGHHGAELPRARDARVDGGGGGSERRERHRDAIEAVVARDLLDQIDLARRRRRGGSAR